MQLTLHGCWGVIDAGVQRNMRRLLGQPTRPPAVAMWTSQCVQCKRDEFQQPKRYDLLLGETCGFMARLLHGKHLSVTASNHTGGHRLAVNQCNASYATALANATSGKGYVIDPAM
jgi:hypothetical protein